MLKVNKLLGSPTVASSVPYRMRTSSTLARPIHGIQAVLDRGEALTDSSLGMQEKRILLVRYHSDYKEQQKDSHTNGSENTVDTEVSKQSVEY